MTADPIATRKSWFAGRTASPFILRAFFNAFLGGGADPLGRANVGRGILSCLTTKMCGLARVASGGALGLESVCWSAQSTSPPSTRHMILSLPPPTCLPQAASIAPQPHGGRHRRTAARRGVLRAGKLPPHLPQAMPPSRPLPPSSPFVMYDSAYTSLIISDKQ